MKGPLPAGGILPHALGDADDLAVTILADADGDQDADVLHASAPGALVPYAVHEQVWVLVIQRPRAPFVDLGVHALELVAQCPGRHAVAPQQLAGVVDLPGGHAGQVHVNQRLLCAFLASAVAFDHRGPEQGTLQFRHLELEPAGLGGQAPLVVVFMFNRILRFGAGDVLLDSSLIPSPPIMPQDRARVDDP